LLFFIIPPDLIEGTSPVFSFASLLLASYIARVKIEDRESKIDDRKINPIDPQSCVFDSSQETAS